MWLLESLKFFRCVTACRKAVDKPVFYVQGMKKLKV